MIHGNSGRMSAPRAFISIAQFLADSDHFLSTMEALQSLTSFLLYYWHLENYLAHSRGSKNHCYWIVSSWKEYVRAWALKGSGGVGNGLVCSWKMCFVNMRKVNFGKLVQARINEWDNVKPAPQTWKCVHQGTPETCGKEAQTNILIPFLRFGVELCWHTLAVTKCYPGESQP